MDAKKYLLTTALIIIGLFARAQTYSLNRLTDICIGPCYSVRGIASYNGLIYFSAVTPTNAVGLWKTDGTIPGTSLIKEVGPDFSSAYNYLLEGPVTSNGLFFFGAKTFQTGGFSLWRSDGTTNGTFLLTGPSNPANIVELNGFVLFWAFNAANGNELWRSDGTQAGTYLVMDINPGTLSSVPGLSDYGAVINNKLFFQADDGVHGNECWVSDGTKIGTYMVQDLYPGSWDGYFQVPVVYHNEIYFRGSSQSQGGGIFKTNGTPGAVTKVLNDGWYKTPAILNDTLYFSTKTSPSLGEELYKSNCTSFQVFLVKDINPGTNYSNPSFITEINGNLYFVADDGVHGQEAWISDGSNLGTQMIKDIDPGTRNGCQTSAFKSANGKVYFIGNEQTYGKEIYETDGTSSGTKVYDIKPGPNSSNPINFRDYNNELYIKANDGTTGDELWKIGATLTNIPGYTNLISGVNIYPNPVSDYIKVSGFSGAASFNLYNLQGKLILSKTLTGDEPVNVSGLSRGAYTYNIIIDRKQQAGKLIKK